MVIIAKLIFYAFNILVTSVTCNKRDPVIGILTQELNLNWAQFYPNKTAYIAASYVKAVEASGAQVIPVFLDRNESYYRDILSSINGLVLPGGAATCNISNGYCETLKEIYKIVIEMNDQGNYFPVLGVCLGFEMLLQISQEMIDIRTRCDINFQRLALKFVPNYRRSQLYAELPMDIYKILKHDKITIHYHKWCITPENFTMFDFEKDWKITSTSKKKNNLKFVSTVEHVKYPIIGTQFHPEKVPYEWLKVKHIAHSFSAIKANRYFYDMIVNMARSNNQNFKNVSNLMESLIYNYSPIASYDITGYMQIYVF